MRNLLTLLLLCCCFSPAFAQGNFWRGLTHWKTPAVQTGSISARVKSTIARTWLQATRPANSYIQITNMPGQPFVKLGAPLPAQEGTLTRSSAVLPARMLTGEESYKKIFLGMSLAGLVYAPAALNTGEEVVYRGMKLYDLQSIQNILENGMEYTKASKKNEWKIYFSNSLSRAAQYSIQYDSPESEIPVLVRFVMPDKNLVYARKHIIRGIWDYHYRMRNISVRYIEDVMVFLEVNGKAGWYKAVLENGKLVFTPMPSEVFNEQDLIKYIPDIPKENIYKPGFGIESN